MRNGSGPLSDAGRLLADLAETVVRVSLSELTSRSILPKKDVLHLHIPCEHMTPSVTGWVSIGDLKKKKPKKILFAKTFFNARFR